MSRKPLGLVTAGSLIAGAALLLATAGYGAKVPPPITMSAVPASPKAYAEFTVKIRFATPRARSCALTTPSAFIFGTTRSQRQQTVNGVDAGPAGRQTISVVCVNGGKFAGSSVTLTLGGGFSNAEVMKMLGGGVPQRASLTIAVRP